MELNCLSRVNVKFKSLRTPNFNIEIFHQSPLSEDHKPRSEVIAAFLDYAANPTGDNSWAGTTMVGPTFYACAADQWDLILELIKLAPDDPSVLGSIAAGPLEGYLGKFSDTVVQEVENQAALDEKFLRVLSGVWQHGMSDEVWQRIRSLQKTVRLPLPEMQPFTQAE